MNDKRNNVFLKYKKDGALLSFGYDNIETYYRRCEHDFSKTPTKSEVLDLLINHINKLTDEKILSGFVWNGVNVWLSTENLFNFKAAYDVAVLTNGASLPIKFKLGEIDNVPLYYTFEDMATFTDFYTKAIAFIMNALNDGWIEKDYAKTWVESLDLKD